MKRKRYFYILIALFFLIILLIIYKLLIIDKNTAKVGVVEGKVYYPSSGIPDGFILAKNINTNQIKEIHFVDKVRVGDQDFSILLDEGVYVFAYKPILINADGNYEGPYGFYTENCLAVNDENNPNPKSHELVKVKVEKNKTANNVSICDYYYPEDNKPNF